MHAISKGLIDSQARGAQVRILCFHSVFHLRPKLLVDSSLEMADLNLTMNINCFVEQLAWSLKAFSVMDNGGREEVLRLQKANSQISMLET